MNEHSIVTAMPTKRTIMSIFFVWLLFLSLFSTMSISISHDSSFAEKKSLLIFDLDETLIHTKSLHLPVVDEQEYLEIKEILKQELKDKQPFGFLRQSWYEPETGMANFLIFRMRPHLIETLKFFHDSNDYFLILMSMGRRDYIESWLNFMYFNYQISFDFYYTYEDFSVLTDSAKKFKSIQRHVNPLILPHIDSIYVIDDRSDVWYFPETTVKNGILYMTYQDLQQNTNDIPIYPISAPTFGWHSDDFHIHASHFLFETLAKKLLQPIGGEQQQQDSDRRALA